MSEEVTLHLRFTVDVTYKGKPENYPKGYRTPEGMLEVDLKNADDDPHLIMGMEGAKWKIKGRIVR